MSGLVRADVGLVAVGDETFGLVGVVRFGRLPTGPSVREPRSTAGFRDGEAFPLPGEPVLGPSVPKGDQGLRPATGVDSRGPEPALGPIGLPLPGGDVDVPAAAGPEPGLPATAVDPGEPTVLVGKDPPL
jgi:hypothetical protein